MSIFQNTDAMITFLVAVGSSATTLLVTKIQTKKDVQVNSIQAEINDRSQLSEDEKAFRQELRATIDEYKEELKEARKEITLLRKEVGELHNVNLKLTLENKQLSIKVDDLKSELQRLSDGK